MPLIKEWLTNHGSTQEALARRIDVSNSFMNGLANGKYALIKVDVLKRICDVTAIPMVALVDDLLKQNEINQRADDENTDESA